MPEQRIKKKIVNLITALPCYTHNTCIASVTVEVWLTCIGRVSGIHLTQQNQLCYQTFNRQFKHRIVQSFDGTKLA